MAWSHAAGFAAGLAIACIPLAIYGITIHIRYRRSPRPLPWQIRARRRYDRNEALTRDADRRALDAIETERRAAQARSGA